MTLQLVTRGEAPRPGWPGANPILAPIEAEFTIGMPHLDLRGLGELYVIKEAGHLHWQVLEALVGRRSRDWWDGAGRRCYGSFVYSSLRYHEVRGQESDLATVRCEPLGYEAPFAATRTEVRVDGALAMTVELLSAFIARVGDDNVRFVRSEFGSSGLAFGPEALAEFKARRRRLMTPAGAMDEVDRYGVVAEADFNNAAFMYFANFTRVLQGADLRRERHSVLKRRDIAYAGNVDPGETLVIRTGGVEAVGYQLARQSDGQPVVFSEAAFL